MTVDAHDVIIDGIISAETYEKLATVNKALNCDEPLSEWEELYLGFDLGTTNLKLVAFNEAGQAVNAVLFDSRSSLRDGVIVDYIAAIEGMRKCLRTLKKRLGCNDITAVGAAAYPPGISQRTAQVCANVVEALGLPCMGLYEEPVVAATALGMQNGAIVDIGGGTTGIAVVQDGEVVYSADEPTGGTHVTLVLAGALGISFDEAEKLKRNSTAHKKIFNITRPVFEKMGVIARDHLAKSGFLEKERVIVVGGGANIEGASEVISQVLETKAILAPFSLIVTSVGIAECLWRRCHGGHNK